MREMTRMVMGAVAAAILAAAGSGPAAIAQERPRAAAGEEAGFFERATLPRDTLVLFHLNQAAGRYAWTLLRGVSAEDLVPDGAGGIAGYRSRAAELDVEGTLDVLERLVEAGGGRPLPPAWLSTAPEASSEDPAGSADARRLPLLPERPCRTTYSCGTVYWAPSTGDVICTGACSNCAYSETTCS
ncbi:MAG TPA: hypothetical protein VNI57_04585 [Candidatus Saccharimonadales bacterium]|nr:hypothetical protein [Candidatus Saccharimonadales bacterium]